MPQDNYVFPTFTKPVNSASDITLQLFWSQNALGQRLIFGCGYAILVKDYF